MNYTTKKLVIAALMTAFTCIATMVIKISTPTFGYIHLGDGMVLLSGIVLGPAAGALAAGAGSMLSVLGAGYIFNQSVYGRLLRVVVPYGKTQKKSAQQPDTCRNKRTDR